MREIIIIGAGGLGLETADLIEQINESKPYKTWKILGFVDDNIEMHGRKIGKYEVLGDVKFLINKFKCKRINVVIAIADTEIKRKLLYKTSSYFKFPTLIHPTSIISKSSTIGKGCLIFANCIISSEVKIRDFVTMNPKCGIGHNSKICDFSSLMWNVNVSGNVTIMRGCYLGTNCTIIQNVTIEPTCTIGAGAVVINDVKYKSTMVGVPAIKIK